MKMDRRTGCYLGLHQPVVSASIACLLNQMDDLIRQLRLLFSVEPVAIEDVEKLLSAYKSRQSDWSKYAHFDDRHYTRNLVDTGDGRYNMLLLCWGPGMCTNIHDHSGSHCFVKVLEGQLMETRFAFPTTKEIGPLENIGESIAEENDVTYMSDSLGLHRMENPSHCEPAVSLHIYSPAYQTCHLFDQRTSQRHVSQVTFWSKYGSRVDEKTPFDAIRLNVERPSTSSG